VTITDDLRKRVKDHPLWYHVLELSPGIETPGWFDLRPIVDSLPWPDVANKRCLDIGTYDGYLAFEMERRGAAEVVAVDIADHDKWDWPPELRAKGGAELARLAGPDKGAGFRLAHEAIGSRVDRREISIYDLDPDEIGKFDVVVCGSLMLHLRDPLRALEAVRTVTSGLFMSSETIDLPLTLTHPRKAVARLLGVGELCQWWIPNAQCHQRMLRSSGFEIVQATKPYAIRYGVAHPTMRAPRQRAHALLQRSMAGGPGVPHAAVLARPML
jgi:tRNA (mo5U34)-methyltransferase